LDQHFLVEPDYAIGYEFAVALVLGLVLMVWLPRLSAGRALWLCAVLASVVVGGQSWLYVRHGLVLPVVSSVCLIAVAFVLNMVDGYWIEGRSKRQLARLFGTYVPPELVQKMVQAPADYTMQASSKELTVMFCDMHGFTHLAETLSPVQLQQLLNRTLSMLTHIIGQHHGTIDKYMGDCVMAFWGAPVANPLHASQAVQAGLAIEQAMVSLNAQHAALQLPPIKVGIGINTGSMLVGDMGSDIRRSYTVVGDAVNLAARLESLSRTYGCTMLVGQATQQQTPNVAWQWLDRVQVKGKDDAVRIYAPSSATPQELELWAQCLLAYGQQEWVLCLHCLHDLAQRPGVQGTGRAHLYDLYAQRVAQFQVRPPPQPWQGVMRYVH
jgi:adenylate cyclase